MQKGNSLINKMGESIGTRKNYEYSHKVLAKILIVQEGIHEGHWQIDLKFDVRSKNVILEKGESFPGMLLTALNVGLLRQDKETERSVDASKANPLPKEMN